MTDSISDRLRWLSWSQPKHGHGDHEYEDAVAANPHLGRFAIADGASESAFSGDWARCLVRSYVEHRHDALVENDWFAQARREFGNIVAGRPLPWYLEEQLREGAHAAFLGFSLTPRADHMWDWHAVAVGDCCFFHLRGSRLTLSFPLTSSGDFNQLPKLIDSRWDSLPVQRQTWGRACTGDVFLLMTDALAKWSLERDESRTPIWSDLLRSDALPGLVQSASAAGQLRNDDVTLLLIELRPETHD